MNRITVPTVFTDTEDFLRKLNKQYIGHDRLFSSAFSNTPLNPSNYPPYNIEKISDDNYQLTLAVAGFGKDELEVTVDNGNLKVLGSKKDSQNDESFLYKGIATRDFHLSFTLGEYIKVSQAIVENGLLVLSLVREVPEAMKPKTIEIK